MKEAKNWQKYLLTPLGIILVALLLYRLDPLQLKLQRHAHRSASVDQPIEKITRNEPIDPLFVKGFKQLDGQYFVVILADVAPAECPCSDPKVRLGKKQRCPVVHHREKKSIIARGRKLGLPEYNFPVLEVCDWKN
ncbi:MAG: hypothetical protein R2824_01690 [Saprospiraceae bacterium]